MCNRAEVYQLHAVLLKRKEEVGFAEAYVCWLVGWLVGFCVFILNTFSECRFFTSLIDAEGCECRSVLECLIQGLRFGPRTTHTKQKKQRLGSNCNLGSSAVPWK